MNAPRKYSERWGSLGLHQTSHGHGAGYYNLIKMRNNRLTSVVIRMSTGFSLVYKDSHTMIYNISIKVWKHMLACNTYQQ